ncbi:MAG: hypothetical protein FWG85_06900 [Bacteroidetes bacterium]|nr:hypothetical protein [Bacteroidota bacterium]
MENNFLKNTILILFLIYSLSSCGNPVPDDYIETILLEALLIVDNPIKDIRLTKTLSLNEDYYYGNALIKNANIFIYEGENEIKLKFKQYDSANIKKSAYYYEDTNYLVKPNTEYKLKVILSDGNEITGRTTTPYKIEWVSKMADIVSYPDDTLNLPPNENAQSEWNKNGNMSSLFIYSVTCLDTMNYGKYLDIPTGELNRRIRIRNHNHNDETPRPAEVTINSVTILPKSILNWNFCRWFGPHSLKIYVPDKNYEQWFMYYLMLPNFHINSYSVEGAIGYFGSAAMIEDTFFLKKNKYASIE